MATCIEKRLVGENLAIAAIGMGRHSVRSNLHFNNATTFRRRQQVRLRTSRCASCSRHFADHSRSSTMSRSSNAWNFARTGVKLRSAAPDEKSDFQVEYATSIDERISSIHRVQALHPNDRARLPILHRLRQLRSRTLFQQGFGPQAREIPGRHSRTLRRCR